ncbi:hypothetical protein [Halobaculum sp. D14]|uniref:hypothetical protein n=1 Tax=Halobaculum sp. D14 TaxID=3421642 RepID=UPI003EB703E9
MGLMDKLTGGENSGQESEDDREMYGPDDLSDEVTAWFVDPWPSNKPLGEYELIFMVDEAVEDPIVLHCGRELPIPDGTQVLAYDEMVAVPWQETTIYVTRGLLVDPDIADFTGEEDFFSIPEPMQKRIIPPREGKKSELVQMLASGMAAAHQANQEEQAKQS